MVAEPVGSAADVLARAGAIEEKLKSLANMLSTVGQQATEAVGRSVLTNVRVNHVVTRLEALSTTSTQVKAASLEEATGSEHKSNNNIPANQAGVSDEFVKVEEGCVKAIIGLRDILSETKSNNQKKESKFGGGAKCQNLGFPDGAQLTAW